MRSTAWYRTREVSDRFVFWTAVWNAEQRYSRGDTVVEEQRVLDFVFLAKAVQDRAAQCRQGVRAAASDARAFSRLCREVRYAIRVLEFIASGETRSFVRAQMKGLIASLAGLAQVSKRAHIAMAA